MSRGRVWDNCTLKPSRKVKYKDCLPSGTDTFRREDVIGLHFWKEVRVPGRIIRGNCTKLHFKVAKFQLVGFTFNWEFLDISNWKFLLICSPITRKSSQNFGWYRTVIFMQNLESSEWTELCHFHSYIPLSGKRTIAPTLLKIKVKQSERDDKIRRSLGLIFRAFLASFVDVIIALL